MRTETTPDHDLDFTILEALDEVMPCHGLPEGDHGCENPAEWIVIFNCGCPRVWCDEHLQYGLNCIKKALTMYTYYYRCMTCQQTNVSFVSVEPYHPGG